MKWALIPLCSSGDTDLGEAPCSQYFSRKTKTRLVVSVANYPGALKLVVGGASISQPRLRFAVVVGGVDVPSGCYRLTGSSPGSALPAPPMRPAVRRG